MSIEKRAEDAEKGASSSLDNSVSVLACYIRCLMTLMLSPEFMIPARVNVLL